MSFNLISGSSDAGFRAGRAQPLKAWQQALGGSLVRHCTAGKGLGLRVKGKSGQNKTQVIATQHPPVFHRNSFILDHPRP